jgi:uncharacterized membrane protein YhaH (DUF805 family)
MGDVMKKLLAYLSFNGRANRQPYWVRGLLLVVVGIIAMMLTLGMSDIVPILGILAIPVMLVFMIAVLANSARRLHDRNKSAWWLLLFIGLPTILSIPGDIAKASGDQGGIMLGALCALLGLPFSLWGFVELGCLRGTTGSNRYGDDPLTSPVAEVFA